MQSSEQREFLFGKECEITDQLRAYNQKHKGLVGFSCLLDINDIPQGMDVEEVMRYMEKEIPKSVQQRYPKYAGTIIVRVRTSLNIRITRTKVQNPKGGRYKGKVDRKERQIVGCSVEVGIDDIDR